MSEEVEYTDKRLGPLKLVKDFLPSAGELNFRTSTDSSIDNPNADSDDLDDLELNADQR